MSKVIWLAKSETKITVRDGKVTVWEEMTVSPKAVAMIDATGFGTKKPHMAGAE